MAQRLHAVKEHLAQDKMRRGKVAVFTKPGDPIDIRDEVCPDPAAGELVVRIDMAGVCGTDVHRLAGDVPASATAICFGHEAVGTVEAVGAGGVLDWSGQALNIGDCVYWAPSTPCGQCTACKGDNQMRCKDLNWPPSAEKPNAAGFRQFATLSSRHNCFKIADRTAAAAVITFGCAMPTALRGLSKLGPLGRNVVIQGSGPVGLASTLLAKLGGAEKIVVIGDPSGRLEAAKQLGATETLSLSKTTTSARRDRIDQIFGGQGATEVIEAAGHISAFGEGMDLLGMNGRYLIMGLYSGSTPTTIDPVRINNLNLQIIGSLGIRPQDYQRTVEIAEKHGREFKLQDMISSRCPLSALEAAIDHVRKLQGIKVVIEPWA